MSFYRLKYCWPKNSTNSVVANGLWNTTRMSNVILNKLPAPSVLPMHSYRHNHLLARSNYITQNIHSDQVNNNYHADTFRRNFTKFVLIIWKECSDWLDSHSLLSYLHSYAHAHIYIHHIAHISYHKIIKKKANQNERKIIFAATKMFICIDQRFKIGKSSNKNSSKTRLGSCCQRSWKNSRLSNVIFKLTLATQRWSSQCCATFKEIGWE